MKKESYPSAANWFARVLHGQTYAHIARSCEVASGASLVGIRVANLYRILNQPRYAVEKEVPPPQSSHTQLLPKAVREHHEYYSARLANFCDQVGLDKEQVMQLQVKAGK